jgi:alpha-L-fucosidase
VYQNMAAVRDWMKLNGPAVQGAGPLPPAETASVPATARGDTRYLFAIPQFRGESAYPEAQLPPADEVLKLWGLEQKPRSVTLLSTGQPLEFSYTKGAIVIPLPASLRSSLVDVISVTLR